MIRAARDDDLQQLLALAVALRDESPTMRDISVDEQKLIALFRRAFDPADLRFCLFVHSVSNVIHGAVFGFVAEYYFSRERYAADLFLYIDPSCRRGLMSGVIAKRLWERYRDWAVECGVREIRNGVSTGIAIDGAHRFFLSLGMRHIGGSYRLPLAR